MSTEMKLARLGLLDLVDDPEKLKAALEENLRQLRNKNNTKKGLRKTSQSAIVLPVQKLGVIKTSV